MRGYDTICVDFTLFPELPDTSGFKPDIKSCRWTTKSLTRQRRQFRVKDKRLELLIDSNWEFFPYYGCVRISKLFTSPEYDIWVEVLFKFDDGFFVSSKLVRTRRFNNSDRLQQIEKFKAVFVRYSKLQSSWWYKPYTKLWYKPVFFCLRLLRKSCRLLAKTLVRLERFLLPF